MFVPKLLSILLVSLLSHSGVCSPVATGVALSRPPPIPTEDAGKLTYHFGTEEMEILTLPEGFDMAHPLLNTSHYLSLVDAGSAADIPKLPDDLPIVKVQVETKLVCEASDASPYAIDIKINADKLYTIANAWCCQTYPGPNKCQKLTAFITAATDICAQAGTCVRCLFAAESNVLIATYCKKGQLAGGYMRYAYDFAGVPPPLRAETVR
jgi:hypothetical protein